MGGRRISLCNPGMPMKKNHCRGSGLVGGGSPGKLFTDAEGSLPMKAASQNAALPDGIIRANTLLPGREREQGGQSTLAMLWHT